MDCIFWILLICLVMLVGKTEPASSADLRENPDYLETQIKHISDADLFAALDLNRPGLAAVKASVDAGDYPAAYQAWGEYWAEKDKITLAQYGNPELDGELLPAAEIEGRLRADPAQGKSWIQRADPIMRHEITGWGSVTHQHGAVVDFNFDYGYNGKFGFHYWFWAEPLLMAYHATGDTKYIAEFDSLFNQWYEQRDVVPTKVIWDDLGMGLRSRHFLHYYTCPFPQRPFATHEHMLKTLLGAGRKLCLDESVFYSGNHQISASYGLVDIAVRLPEFRESTQWRETGITRLIDHIEREFHADGCHVERAPSSYMPIAYLAPRDLLTLLRAAGIETEATALFDKRLEKVLEWWMWAATPMGTLPALNDGSERAFPAAWLRAGAAEYHRPDFRAVVERLVDGNKKPLPDLPTATSMHLEPSGVAIMRSDWNSEAGYLFLNYGTHNAWHTHNATLDFELYAHSDPLALDAGIGLTYDDPLHWSWYTTARAHNMLVVDDASVDRATARGQDVLWHSDNRLDVFAATHAGYAKSHGVIHRRTITFLKPDTFVVFDTCMVEAEGHMLSWYFHSPTDLVVQPDGRVVSAKGPGALLAVASPEQLKGVRKGKGMCSLAELGGYREIDWVALDKPARRDNDNSFVILILPFADSAPEVEFTTAPSPPGTACVTLRRGDRTDTLIFGNGKPLVLLDGRLVTDGHFAWVHSQGIVRQGRIVGGDTLTWAGQPLPPLEK